MPGVATLHPEGCSNAERLDVAFSPPIALITGCMVFGVVDRAQRNGELIAYLEAYAFGLRETDMMGLGWCTTADKAGLTRDKAEMFF